MKPKPGRAETVHEAYNSVFQPIFLENWNFMRRIGTLSDQTLARRFRNYLLTRSVDAVIERGDGVSWEIWIRSEDDVEVARTELVGFQAAPDDERFIVDDQAERIREKKVDQQWELRRQLGQKTPNRAEPTESDVGTPIDSDPIDSGPIDSGPIDSKPIAASSSKSADDREPFDSPTPLLDSEARQAGFPVAIAIIALSVIASFSTNFGQPRGSRIPGRVTMEQQIFHGLTFVDRREYEKHRDPFADLKKGEVWRLITPMFLHGNMLHLVFNMFFIFLLGSMIERIHGSWTFLLIVLLTQVAAMMVQVLIPDADFIPESLRGSPYAIGASGVAYGLFGFMLVRPWLDADYPIELDATQRMVIIAGLIVCMTPLVQRVANGAHLGGLAAGMLIAAIGYVIWR